MNALRSRKNPASMTSRAEHPEPHWARSHSTCSTLSRIFSASPCRSLNGTEKLGICRAVHMQLGVDAAVHPEPPVHRGHRVRAQLAGRRERVGDRPPQSMADVAPYRMREAEGDVGVVAIHDHRHEQAVQCVPYRRVGGQRGECREDPRPVLRDVAAVQPQALLADPDRGMRIHGSRRRAARGAGTRTAGGRNRRRRRGSAARPRRCGRRASVHSAEAGVRLLHRRFGLGQHQMLQPLLRSAVAMALIDS